MPITRQTNLLYVQLAIPLFVLFAVVYGGANWLNSLREQHYHFYFDWELSIPFVPEMIVIYFSIQLLFLLPILHCQDTEMYTLAKRMALATILSGILFVLLPTQSGFPRHDNVDVFQPIFNLLYQLDRPHNLFPSMHICLCTLVITIIYPRINTMLRVIYLIWLGLLYLSVLLVHQHHLIDIVGGLLLTAICIWIIPNAKTQKTFAT